LFLPKTTTTHFPYHSTNTHKQNKGNAVSKSRHVLSPQAERGGTEKERRYHHAEKDGLGDAMGVSKHGRKKQDMRGGNEDATGDQMRRVKQRRGINPIRVFLGFSFLSERGMMSELHERFVAS